MGKVIDAAGLSQMADVRKFRKYAESALDTFLRRFLAVHNKIVNAEDLIPGLLYTYVSGVTGCKTRCILWSGLGKRAAKIMKETVDYDAQININVEPAEYDNTSFVFIARHEENTEFLNPGNWRFLD